MYKNLLCIKELKKKYKYKEILSSCNDEKVKNEIELDVVRTNVGDVENPEKTREQITNILCAISSVNENIKYLEDNEKPYNKTQIAIYYIIVQCIIYLQKLDLNYI